MPRATSQHRGVDAPAGHALFTVGTTYHTFLACGLATALPRSTRRHLIIHIDFADGMAIVETLRDLAAPLFDEISVLPRSEGIPAPRWRVLVAANILRTAWLAARRRYDRVYIFNEDRPVHQAAAYWARRRNPNAIAYCGEDGTSDYGACPMWDHRRFTDRVSRRLLYGWWYRNVRWRCTVPWVDRHLLTHPEHLRNPAHSKPIERMPSSCFRSGTMADLATAYAARRGLTDQEVARLDGIVFLSKSQKVGDRAAYVADVRLLLQRARADGLQVAVKHHPGERQPDPFGFRDDRNTVVLPRGLATEFLFVHPACRFRFVISGLSTTLLTARWLRPQTTAISVTSLVGRHDQQILDMLGKMGVHMVASVADALPLLHASPNAHGSESLAAARSQI